RVVPASINQELAGLLRRAALSAWHALGCRDYARVDFRLDDAGNFVILEVNPNPDISPDSGFEAALKSAKIPFHNFVLAIYSNALTRLGNTYGKTRPKPVRSANQPLRKRPFIRHSQPSDRNAILAFMRDTGYFHGGEIEVAQEVLDEALAKGPAGHYQSFTLVAGGAPAGWICYGPTPCTIGTFDIYWIGVSVKAQGKGYGRALLDHAEGIIRKKGRLVVIETSGRSLYDATRGFYLRTGYSETARIPNFYAPGDDRVIYSKALDGR
ncbi:MAG: GNAT family N-acetyltransferase, partial [bacterium]